MIKLNILLCVVLFFVACQTQPDTVSPNLPDEHPLEKEEVIPMERTDVVESETSHFDITKDQTNTEEDRLDKIRFRKINVNKNLQNNNIALESILIYPVDQKNENDSIKRANLQINNLLQKWFDLNFQKLTGYLPSKAQTALNEVEINFVARNKIQVEISSPIEGTQALSEDISF